ncbi:hypothetical protein [Paenibacillus flagellatus]|uniref:hypothetical protein n=1 Tax=Paenibacillus flagellatus TaxID=2211139 RepID=UPI0013054449|nr:hypothetical protein [Paenibacillus flagellatus]
MLSSRLRFAVALPFVAIVLLAAACGNKPVPPVASSGAALPGGATKVESAPASLADDITGADKTDLRAIQEKLTGFRETLKNEYAVEMLAVGTGSDHLLMTIRRYGDVDEPIGEDELARIRKALFDYAGSEFPLKLAAQPCCKQADITGEIKKIDNGRVLIVDETKKNGNTDDPVATWVTLSPTAKSWKAAARSRSRSTSSPQASR